jgi:dTDP-4-amino-4,6-dideoxygalactose transaminase
MNVPYLDLRSQYTSIKSEIDSAFKQVFQKMRFIGGEEVESFEKEFASFLHVKHVIAVNSGTDALILGIEALKFSPGDEVIVPVNTFYATALAVIKNQLKPVFVDTDAHYGISLSDLKRKITSRTKAIIIVHLYGQPDDIDGIKAVIQASHKDIFLIEDACQAHGAVYHNQNVGTFGVFSAFSFYPGKNLGAYGDGGVIATNDDVLAQKYRLLREYGQTSKYHHETIGTNSRLDSFQAAILRKKLVHLEDWNTRRRAHAEYYNECFKGSKSAIIPEMLPDRKSVFHIYAVRVQKRQKLQKYLLDNGIETLIHYPVPLHLTRAFLYLKYKQGDFPVAEKQAEELLSLPMYPELTNAQIEYVVNTIKTFYMSENRV